VLIELDQKPSRAAQSACDPPELFVPLKIFTGASRPTAIGVMFENGPSVLDNEHGKARLFSE